MDEKKLGEVTASQFSSPNFTETKTILNLKREKFRKEIRHEDMQKMLNLKRLKSINERDSEYTNGLNKIRDEPFDSGNQSGQSWYENLDTATYDQASLIENLEKELVENVKQNNTGKIFNIVTSLNKLVGDHRIVFNLDILCESNILSSLLGLMDSTNDEGILLKATNILINVSAGETRHLEYLYQLNVLSRIEHILRTSSSKELVADVIWIISNLAAETDFELRFKLLEDGLLVKDILRNLEKITNVEFYEIVLNMVKSFVRLPTLPFSENEGFLHILRFFLLIETEQVLTELTLDLIHVILEDLSIFSLELAVNRCSIHKIIALASNENLARKALMVLSDFSRGSKNVTYLLYEKGIFDVILKNLNKNGTTLRVLSALVLGNMMADGEFMVNKLLGNRELLLKILELAEKDTWNVAKECLVCFLNAIISSNNDQLQIMVDKLPLLELIIYHLHNEQETFIIRDMLGALSTILNLEVTLYQNCPVKPFTVAICRLGIEKKLENLLTHKSHSIYELAKAFCEKYFETEEFQL